MKRFMAFLVVIAGIAMAVSSLSAVAATKCNGQLSGAIAGAVVVKAGPPCTLDGATVSGGVRVENGGVLFLCGSVVNGGVTGDGAAAIIIGAEEIGCDGNIINGGVRISNTGPSQPGGPPSVAVENSAITGGVHLQSNQGAVAVAFNTIVGGLFCRDNAFSVDDEGGPSTITGPVTCTFGD